MPGPLDHVEFHDELKLRDPVLVAAFRGWNDAGDAASFAAMHLGRVWGAHKIASINPEEFYDFQAVRPQVRLVDGLTREITWPANEFWAARLESSDRDVMVLVGTEPNLKWKAFSRIIVEVAKAYDVNLLITLGALLADVAHSRPVPLTGTAVDNALVESLGLTRSRYEGPTGIVGVLQEAFGRNGLASASLWAAVPHYVAVTPNPKAALALARKATDLIGASADVDALENASLTYERKVSEMVASDEDVQAYVKLLEQQSDAPAEQALDPSQIPSGDALAAEFERFLRDRNEG